MMMMMMMKESKLFILTIIVFFFIGVDAGGVDTAATVVYSKCSDVKFSPTSPYQYNLNSLLTSLTNAAQFSPYSNFTASIISPVYPVSGLYQCRADLSFSDCGSCVRTAVSQLAPLCSNSAAAAVQLRGCLVQYGNESFVGKADKNLQFKRCGPGMNTGGYDPNIMAMRDDVLTALTAEQGSYRQTQAGYVNGVGQCVGDQDGKHCKDCLSEAVADLKNYCGGMVSGEVYLGKCYAEYSAQGVQYSSSSPSHDHGNDAGKDLAIIIGIVAAVLLLIFFIQYLRKSSNEKGKA